MNPSTALATVLVDELVCGGVTDAVLSPGSRNAPLSLALYDADAAGWLRLHVRIDERSAGFLGLGLAKASGRAVPVVTTSGTAAVNLHPAVIEAAYSGVALIAMTADRPEELRGVGANQTIDQVRLFGADAEYAEIPAPDDSAGQVARWRDVVRTALTAADRGPVHVNVAFREPLVPDGDPSWVESLEADADPRSRLAVTTADVTTPTLLDAGPRTVVVAGDGAGSPARRLAEAAGWPLLAEPSSGARSGPNAIGTYRLLLEMLGPDISRVVVAGRPTLSRPVSRLLARPDIDLVVVDSGNPRSAFRRDGGSTVAAVAPSWVEPTAVRATPDAWLTRWLDADAVAGKAVADVLADDVSGPVIARVIVDALPPGALLVAGSSASIRDLDLVDPPTASTGPRLLANRGASGIDGTVSTAIGAALGHDGPAYALMGDLTFLHDSNGLVIGPGEPRPDLTIVVGNDDGGGLFALLEQGGPEHAHAFERVFGTPHGVDLAALCAATGTAYTLAGDADELRAALAPRAGISVVEVRTDRARRRDLDHRLRDAVTAALTP